jgi:hypothetical protein
MQHTTMFAHDDTTIYYPTAPGRVFSINFTSLSDCDGSDADYEDSTATGDLFGLFANPLRACRPVHLGTPPQGWLGHGFDDDFVDAVEMWDDYCDRQSVRLDTVLDGAPQDVDAAGVLARLRQLVSKPPYTMATLAEVVAAIGEGQPAVAV